MKIAGSRALLVATTLTGASLSLASSAAAAGEPADVSRVSGGVVYFAEGATDNRVEVFADSTGELTVVDTAGLDPRGECLGVITSPSAPVTTVKCGRGVPSVDVTLGAGNDVITPTVAVPVIILGGEGNDTMRAGLTPDESDHAFIGGAGVDSVTYAGADRFVTVSLDSQPNDGRPGDRDNVVNDVEQVTGSSFPDRITGSAGANQIVAAFGPDTVAGLAGNDTFLEDNRANGADSISGGAGRDEVFYSQRTAPVFIDTDGVADDGHDRELDNVGADVEVVVTGSGNDTVTGAAAANALTSGAGDDVLDGKGGADDLFPGAGEDTASGGAGDDTIDADADGARDVVRCGAGVDVAFIDEGVDVAIGCETLR